jgi:hypothetical protein
MEGEIGVSQHQEAPLTKETLAQAEDPSFTHPVLTVFERNKQRIIDLRKESGNKAPRPQLGFLADALVEAGSFSLEAKDQVGIWARLLSMEEFGFNNKPEFMFSNMITSAFIVQGAENPVWKKFPRWELENPGKKLPEEFTGDTEGLAFVRNRFGQFKKKYEEIDNYLYGSETASAEYYTAWDNFHEPGAREKILTYGAVKDSRTTEMLEKVLDNNWSYTVGTMRVLLNDPLSTQEQKNG